MNLRYILILTQAKLKAESESLKHCQAELNTACEILERILNTGLIDTFAVESFLKVQNRRKRSARDILEDEPSKKIKLDDLALHQTFDSVFPAESRKRKISEVNTQEDLEQKQSMIDLDQILTPPCKRDREKEQELDKLDEKIKKDRESYLNMTRKWSEEKNIRLECQKQAESKKKYAQELKQKLNEDLKNDGLKAATENTLEFLDKVYTGEEFSVRHNQFFSKCGKESQNLLYTGISDPFTDEQTDIGGMKYDFFLSLCNILMLWWSNTK